MLERHTCGNLKSGSTNAIAPGTVSPGTDGNMSGCCSSVSLQFGLYLKLAGNCSRVNSTMFCICPALVGWLVNHTNGSIPVKIPVPPVMIILSSPRTSQLKPTRGDQRTLADGHFETSTRSPLRNVSLAIAWLPLRSSKYVGTSIRKPPVKRKLGLIVHSSWIYKPVIPKESSAPGAVCPLYP